MKDAKKRPKAKEGASKPDVQPAQGSVIPQVGRGEHSSERLEELLASCELQQPKLLYCIRRVLCWVFLPPPRWPDTKRPLASPIFLSGPPSPVASCPGSPQCSSRDSFSERSASDHGPRNLDLSTLRVKIEKVDKIQEDKGPPQVEAATENKESAASSPAVPSLSASAASSPRLSIFDDSRSASPQCPPSPPSPIVLPCGHFGEIETAFERKISL
eukprot:gnl/TRDRNA2_/TRDRNA2_71600_c0_seq1.p1 gnl/TRDRNA2_/TRDRNA2_71600_c0~~gnl/TRDRNA2_/TRDRNA2_71600_c0_seq1.p1  ORF type:complete len:215 (+),score=42.70 gnl/TRDRNA2_/TRDRNA2_71600_c0_seq1:229-873(+)